MTHNSPPSFEEWSHYCLTQAHADDANHEDADQLAVHARQDRVRSLSNIALTEYAIRLFENAKSLVAAYTPEQIGGATWYMFSNQWGFFYSICHADTPQELQFRAFKATATLYLDLYDALCDRRGTERDDWCDDPLDNAVFMIWDMGSIELTALFPEDHPHLVDPSFQLLETVLGRCQSRTCLMSALHGLGHLHGSYPERVERIVRSFLDRRGATKPDWLVQYAEQAREGMVR